MGVYVCRGSISRIEDGSRTVADIEIYALAQALGVEISTLFCGADEFFEKKRRHCEKTQCLFSFICEFIKNESSNIF